VYEISLCGVAQKPVDSVQTVTSTGGATRGRHEQRAHCCQVVMSADERQQTTDTD